MKWNMLFGRALLVLALFWVWLWGTLPATAHDILLLKCGQNTSGEDVTITVLGVSVLPNGLVAEQYATDPNMKLNLITYTPSIGGGDDHKIYPLFYEVDHDGDGYPDKLYIDKKGDGTCEGIVLYEDYNTPGEHTSPSEMSNWISKED